MSPVVFVHSGSAILPEIQAYREHLKARLGLGSQVVRDPHEVKSACLYWFFMGRASRTESSPVIHEYASLSTPPLACLKDALKKLGSPKPNHRIFLNRFVQQQLGFRDHVSASLRDMGVWKGYFGVSHGNRKGSWFYAGAVSKLRGMDKFLDRWVALPDRPELILAGPVDPEILEKFGRDKSLRFLGLLDRMRIAELASQAEYGLNLVPNIYPYKNQTCTKVLEYCAMGLKVVSNETAWMQMFSGLTSLRFFPIRAEEPLNLDAVQNYSFQNPSMEDWEWNRLLDRCGIAEVVAGLLAKG